MNPDVIGRCAAALLMLAGCGDGDPARSDGGVDGGAMDGGPTPDASRLEDASQDAPSDVGVEVDGGSDAGPGLDAGGDCDVPLLAFTGPIPQAVMVNNIDPPDIGCVGTIASGPDNIYQLVASLGAGTYRVTVTPFVETLDPMIYVLDGCDDTAECLAGTMLNGPGEAESLDIELDADQVVYVVVDTEPASGGGPVQIRPEKL